MKAVSRPWSKKRNEYDPYVIELLINPISEEL